MTEPGSRPRRSRGEVSLDLVVAAARECFAEQGITTTRMDDVARRVGVSRVHLYTFVPNRGRMLGLAALARLRELGADLERRASGLSGEVGEAIIDQILATARAGREDPEFVMIAEAMPRSELNSMLTGRASPINEIDARIFGPLLGRALVEGRLRSDVSVDAITEWLQGVTSLLAGRMDLDDDELRLMARRFVLPALFKTLQDDHLSS